MGCVAGLLLMLVSLTAVAQVTVDVKIDSLDLRVGEQAHVTLDVSCASTARLKMPVLKEGDLLTAGVEVVAVAPQDTQQLNDGERIWVSQQYTITSFDTAFYSLPPFVVQVNDKEYTSKSLVLRVQTILIDTVHVDRFYGPKEIVAPPFTWDDWAGIWWLALVLVALSVAFVYLYVRIRDNKPVIKVIKRVPKIPPHTLAMQEINRIKAEKKWADENSKEYYTLLTAALRTYIQNRYGFNAMEMTSSEIIEHLLQQNDDTALDELRNLFRTADLVKFAKYNTLINENDMNLVNAVEYINQTKQEVDPNAKPQKEKITIEEKRSRAYVITLRVGMVMVFFGACLLLFYLIWRLFQLLQV